MGDGQESLRPLPRQATELLSKNGAPRRLTAHLTLVHDVAVSLCEGINALWPNVTFDAHEVAFGAAIHDVGKIRHMEELYGPGHAHEEAGVAFLIEQGVSESQARFARTHGQWQRGDVDFEDLLVALSDTIWKGKRDDALEQTVARLIAKRSRQPEWSVCLRLDDLLTEIAEDSDERLIWQANYAE